MSAPSNRKWWHDAVVYQIYPRSWADSDGDGIGDFDGITSRLDYLVETLPVDAIWVSPFYPSPQADFGYDVADYCDVDPVYGDLDSFKRFLDGCHRRQLKVIIDWVPSHSSDRHDWFVESRSSRDNPKRDWYVWRDPRPDGGPPNNWLSIFGGSAWTMDDTTGQYYLHSFLAEQPDLNWRNPEVEAAMLATLAFWLDMGVDGFRIDVAHRPMKDPRERDNPPARSGSVGYKTDAEYAAFDHIYDVAHADIHLLFRRIRNLVDTYEEVSPRFLVGEIHEYDWRVWASYFGWSLDELHMPFNFVLLPSGVNADAIRRAVEGIEAALPTGAWPNWVYGNHDEPRIAGRLGRHESRAAAVLLLTLRGTPTIYYGDELGMIDAAIPAEDQQDPYGRRKPGFGRDGCRTPMQWDSSTGAGFTEGDHPWLPVGDQDRISVESELADTTSHLLLYRRLLQTRRRFEALRLGDITVLSPWDKDLLVYERTLGDERVVIAVNLSERPANFLRPDCHGLGVVAGTDSKRWEIEFPGMLRLAPWEAVVLA